MPKKRGKSKKTKSSNVPKGTTKMEPVEIVTAAMGIVNVPLKVCRLCEIKDGPFLNIFDPENIMSKKIQELMPFVIAENDDLPHKICFRCSAKVEELHEFIQKCIKSQRNLRVTIDKEVLRISKASCATGANIVKVWKNNLDKNKIANDDICDAVIKKAMEYIKDRNLEAEHDNAKVTESKTEVSRTPDNTLKDGTHDTSQVESLKTLKKGKVESPKNDNSDVIDLSKDTDTAESVNERKITRSVRSNVAEHLTDGLNTNSRRKKNTMSPKPNTRSKEKVTADEETFVVPKGEGTGYNKKKGDHDASLEISKSGKIPHSNGINTADNDNLLEVPNKVKRHLGVAVETKDASLEKPKGKTRISNAIETKTDVEQIEEKSVSNQNEQCKDPPKVFNIMDHVSVLKVNGVGDLFQCRLCNRNFLKKEVVFTHGCAKNAIPKKNVIVTTAPPQPPKATTVKYINTKDGKPTPIPMKTEKPIAATVVPPEVKVKPRIGPASKVKRESSDVSVTNTPQAPTRAHQPGPLISAPSLNGRYTMVPGPNNTYTLVGDRNAGADGHSNPSIIAEKRKSISMDRIPHDSQKKAKPNEQWHDNRYQAPTPTKSESNAMDHQSSYYNVPYPVGLFQTVPRAPVVNSVVKGLDVPVFNVAAARNQTYTIVNTDNPNRLLISTIPPVTQQQNVISGPQGNMKKTYPVKRRLSIDVESRKRMPDPSKGPFTFINVEQSSINVGRSFVPPTQEPTQPRHRAGVQTTARFESVQEYACNMCTETFTRETKLQAHIQAHYSRIDEEDLLRSEKAIRKKIKK